MRASRIVYLSVAALMQIELSTASFAWPGPIPTTGASLAQADEDALALRWLLESSTLASRLGSDGKSAADGPRLFVHLPSGRLVPQLVASASERDSLQIVAVVAEGAVPPALTIKSCPRAEPFRIEGSLAKLGAWPLGARGAEAYALVPLSPPFRCGPDEVVYEVGPRGGPAVETRLPVRPIYTLSATAVLGFDGAIQRSFAVVNGRVVEATDEVGPSAMVGFTWYPRGLDRERLRRSDNWLNPFLAFDLKAPTENFSLGLQLFPRHGLGLAVGVSLHRVRVLDGFALGDELIGNGEVPTRKEWDRAGIGAFVGVALTSAVVDNVKSHWLATTP